MGPSLETGLQEGSSTISVHLRYRRSKVRGKFLCLGREKLRKICWKVLPVGIFLALGVCDAAQTSAQEVLFYVSPNGNDAWSGKLAAANADNTDGPFTSVEKARDAIRQLKARGPLTQPVTVYLRGGLYVLSQPLVFSPQDSGT